MIYSPIFTIDTGKVLAKQLQKIDHILANIQTGIAVY
jgi:hypothetical protein